LILAGGGAGRPETPRRQLAERRGAPGVLTANGRGLLHGHPLAVPASRSLKAVRRLIAEADLVVAAGTEFGPTDYDMYGDGGFAMPANLVRIDIDAGQLARRPAKLAVQADCRAALEAILSSLGEAAAFEAQASQGAAHARTARESAWQEIGPRSEERSVGNGSRRQSAHE